jgi:hypothetical protein
MVGDISSAYLEANKQEIVCCLVGSEFVLIEGNH